MLNFTINDRQLQVEQGQTVLEVALEQGINIPTLCYHKELTPYGACRLCLVEIVDGGREGLEASCVYKVTDGLKVKTDTERVKRARKIVFELLLARCPDAEKIKKLAEEYGVTETQIKLKKKENCILCGLRRKIQTPFNKVSEKCIGCGACAYICPVEALKIEEAD
jgi:NADH dehydrogenase/NADH:ubiquinone oxidoreductase subunit G